MKLSLRRSDDWEYGARTFKGSCGTVHYLGLGKLYLLLHRPHTTTEQDTP